MHKGCFDQTLFAWNSLTGEFAQISFEGNEQVHFFDFRTIQVGEDLYALQLDG